MMFKRKYSYDILDRHYLTKQEFSFMVDVWHYDLPSYWCLCRHSLKSGVNAELYDFWKNRITKIIRQLQRIRVKRGHKRNILNKKLVRELEYDKPAKVNDILSFELIRNNMSVDEVLEASYDFSTNISTIIKVVSNDDYDIDDYLNKWLG